MNFNWLLNAIIFEYFNYSCFHFDILAILLEIISLNVPKSNIGVYSVIIFELEEHGIQNHGTSYPHSSKIFNHVANILTPLGARSTISEHFTEISNSWIINFEVIVFIGLIDIFLSLPALHILNAIHESYFLDIISSIKLWFIVA